ncbi:hypothetical protein NW762_002016 [Fusarium torreyae]|uniref:Uncharacterized protein n=1 Tax=Fusarium torreyae TaxID=1237075 RepID=A0A9W8VM33_9HYPO|nr:hypothetical protein NW762_002016 [Fusarium torreyae]
MSAAKARSRALAEGLTKTSAEDPSRKFAVASPLDVAITLFSDTSFASVFMSGSVAFVITTGVDIDTGAGAGASDGARAGSVAFVIATGVGVGVDIVTCCVSAAAVDVVVVVVVVAREFGSSFQASQAASHALSDRSRISWAFV